MLVKIIHKSIHLLLAIIVLISTSGFTVFEHSCTSSKTYERSFFIPVFSCDHYQEDSDEATHTCCSSHEQEEPLTCGTDKCCDTETTIVKLDVTYELQHQNLKLYVPAIELPLEIPADVETGFDEQFQITINRTHPPPLSGRDLRIFLHQLNSSPLIV